MPSLLDANTFNQYSEVAGLAFTNWKTIIQTVAIICPNYDSLSNDQIAQAVFNHPVLKEFCKELIYRDEELTSASSLSPEYSLGGYIKQCLVMLAVLEQGEDYEIIDVRYITPWLHPAFYWLRARVRELDLRAQNR